MTVIEGPNDDNYFNEFKIGDPVAFKKFLVSNYQFWVKHANKLLRNDLHSQEIVLEAFSRVWDKKRHFTSFNNAKVFVVLKVNEACKEFLIKQMENDNLDSIKIPGARKKKKFSRYDGRRYRKTLLSSEKWLLQLPKIDRQIYILKYYAEMDVKRISYLLGMDPKPVGAILIRANATLKELKANQKNE